MAQKVNRIRLNKALLTKKDRGIVSKAIEISLTKQLITANIKAEIEELGFSECFRGFNSHSGDTYIYTTDGVNFHFSLGTANVNQAGKGLEILITPTKKLKKAIGV